MLKLVKQEEKRDVYEFVDEENDDTRKCQFVYVDWRDDGRPHANHPTTIVAYMTELELKMLGRQKLGGTLLG
jgi:hypothetical protein